LKKALRDLGNNVSQSLGALEIAYNEHKVRKLKAWHKEKKLSYLLKFLISDINL
jgi:hypothetical protein